MTDMEKMQAEAVSNARAMYRRRTPSYSANIQVQTQTKDKPEPEQTLPEAPAEAAADHKTPELLSSLFEDKEKTLILLLIILLSEDGADSAVLMALMYCII